MLIDTSKLYQEPLSRYLKNLFNKFFRDEDSYNGHYILAVSIDDDGINYLCSGSSPGCQKMSLKTFELCRKARGTD